MSAYAAHLALEKRRTEGRRLYEAQAEQRAARLAALAEARSTGPGEARRVWSRVDILGEDA